MTGDFTSLYNGLEKYFSWKGPSRHLQREFQLLDAFDGLNIIEQSIEGDGAATYRKIKPFLKWVFVNIDNLDNDYDYVWSTYK